MSCAVCPAPARGFGWSDPRPRRTPSPPRSFCSMRCLNAYTEIMRKNEGVMPDKFSMEHAAVEACLPALGDVVAAIGMDRPLADYARDEILQIIATIVLTYREHLIAEHERLAARDRAYFDQRRTQLVSGVPF